MKRFLLLIICMPVFWSANAQTGNVGVGNNTPVAKLDVAGDLALREGTAIAATGASPAIAIALNATSPENSFYRITGTPTGTMTLNSISNGVDGQIITLVNATSIKLKISNTNSSGGILTSGGTPTLIAPNGSVTLQYSSSAARWFVTNAAGATITDWTKAATVDEPAIKTDDQYVTGKAGIGDFSASSPLYSLDVKGSGLYRNGGINTATSGNDQLIFGYAGNNSYMQSIRTRHNSGALAGNAIDFYTWNQGTDGINTLPTKFNMTINGGNVGIGTLSPPSKLHLTDNSGATGIGIGFSANNGSGTGTPTQAQIRVVDNNWSGDMLFETSVPGSGAGALTERMRMKNTGDLQMTGSQGKLWMETNGWSDPGATGAGIAVDNSTFKTLMIVGNNVAGNKGQGREVQMWDYLNVNGYVTVGTQADATATAPSSGTIRYNTTRKCMEYYDGTYWICMGPPTVQKVTVRDIIDGNYTGTGCNACSGWAGSYGGTYNFTINNLYAGQKIMFYVEVFLDNDTHKNGAYANAMKIYGNNYWAEDESPSPGWEASITKVFPAQQINATGNLGFTFESNQGFTDLRITAVAY